MIVTDHVSVGLLSLMDVILWLMGLEGKKNNTYLFLREIRIKSGDFLIPVTEFQSKLFPLDGDILQRNAGDVNFTVGHMAEILVLETHKWGSIVASEMGDLIQYWYRAPPMHSRPSSVG